MKSKKIKVSKIGSALKNMNLTHKVDVMDSVNPMEGEVIAVKALGEEKKYGSLELSDGSLTKIKKGDLIIGVLGERKALAGIVGKVPKKLKIGDVLQILNIGGVIGEAVSWNKDYVDKPIDVEVVGVVSKDQKPLNINNNILRFDDTSLDESVPLIVVMGTSMDVGKTTATTIIINLLSKQLKLKVAAAKLTGIAAQKDIFSMKKAGAVRAMSFLDVGIVSTINHKGLVVPATKTIINELNKEKPDVIVAELGDGIIGWYGVDKLLKDKVFVKSISYAIMCAHDLVGAEGAYKMLKKLNLNIDFFAGPVTNNTAGTDYLENILKIPSADLRYDTTKLLKVIKTKGVI